MEYLNIIFLTLAGISLGYLSRAEHFNKPLNPIFIFLWPVISIVGIIYTNITSLFYFMNMIMLGWFVYKM